MTRANYWRDWVRVAWYLGGSLSPAALSALTVVDRQLLLGALNEQIRTVDELSKPRQQT